MAARHLITLGHRDIAFITGSLDSPTGVERLAGYKDALAGHGIALNEALCEGKLQPGDIACMTAFGGGLTAGSCVIRI